MFMVKYTSMLYHVPLNSDTLNFWHVLESGPYRGVLLNKSYGYFANFDAEDRKCVTYMLFC